MVAISESATAMLLAIATGGMCVLGAVMLRGGFWRPSKLAITALFMSLLAAAGSIAVSAFRGDPVAMVLGKFGKDATLTGRTTLWDYAEAQIAENPLLGVGAGGFWRYNVSPLVQKIYEEFYKEPWHSFSFHSSYYETAVHQGLIGVALIVPAILWAVYWLMRGALSLGTLPMIYFLSTASAVLVRSLTEADFYRPFVLFHMLIWIGALSALLALRRENRLQ
jgi:exopolysaccharide production protein ExoQ